MRLDALRTNATGNGERAANQRQWAAERDCVPHSGTSRSTWTKCVTPGSAGA